MSMRGRSCRRGGRAGACPYGEGITFWALGEILKAHAGILESDPPAAAAAKLDAVLPEGDGARVVPAAAAAAARDRGDVARREREELFTAWRRFLEQIAEERPTVLVFEDLHWADEAMLAFLEHLADLAEGVPLLLVGTARPELLRAPSRLRGTGSATPTRSTSRRCRRRRRRGSSRRCSRRRCCRPSCSSRSSTVPAATRCTRRSSSGC